MAKTVREWIEEQAANALDACETQHGRHFSEGTKVPYFNDLVDACVDEWQGTDDPLDDENEWWKDRTIDYLEEQAEKIVEHLSVIEDEADPEEE